MNDQESAGIEKQNSKEDFAKYFENPESLNKLAELCAYGEVQNLRCRWTAWRAFLGLMPVGEPEKIRAEVKKQRTFYSGEYDKYMNFRSKVKLSADVDNPLSTNTNNPWNSFYTDSELKDEIKKDIERTYQDMDFFLLKSTQTLLTNILFIWSKQNPEPSYRQGMNEICAVLTYACFIERITATNPDENLYEFLNDEQYAEADIYTVFKRVMELDQKQMFVYTPPPKKKKQQSSDGPQRPDLPVVHRSVYVQEDLLPKLTPQISGHFQSLQVEPHIYLMRWLRCMLVREFKITQALCLWDAIFAYHYKFTPKAKKLEMMDYLCVAMILHISKELYDIDNNGMLLGKLLKYPPTEDVISLIQTCHYKVLDVLSSGGNKSSNPAQPTNQFGFKPEEPKPTSFAAPEKKVVLFNPTTVTNIPTSTPPQYTKPLTQPTSSNIPAKHPKSLSGAPTSTTTTTSSTDYTRLDDDRLKRVSSDKPEGFAVSENKGLGGSNRVVLFGQTTANAPVKNEKESPVSKIKDGLKDGLNFAKTMFNGGASKQNTTNVVRDVRMGDTIPTDPERETAECIKKLQNALKLIKLQNDNNQSLEMEEAITDINSVIKTLRDRIVRK